jgi:Bacterial Ig domain
MNRTLRQPRSLTLRLLAAASLLVALLAASSGLSGADYNSATLNPQTRVASAADWVPPTVSLSDPETTVRGTVKIVASAEDTYGSGVTSVRFQRSPAGTGTWTDVCTATAAPYSCNLDTTALANDYYDLRAVATDAAGFIATDTVVDIQVDNLAPVVAMLDPGAKLSGVVTLAAEASDADSGVASATIQRAASGSGNWTDVCTLTASPYSCRFDTRTVAEGSYDFRAVATDVAGNTKASATIQNRRIDNTVSSVSLEDPGAYLHGTVALSANASSAAGVSSVTIQRAPAGKSTWTDVCRLTVAPYSCPFDTTLVADGAYDLRAVMLTGSGSQYTSAIVSSRQVDNTETRGVDVQALNRSSGTAGRLESGDSVSFLYSKQISPGSVLPGWSGTAPATIYVRVRDGNLVGTGSAGDTLQLSSDAAGTAQLRLGSVNLHGDFVKSNKTSTFTATLTASTQPAGATTASSFTVTLGALSSGGALKTAAAAQMIWTPSPLATDLSGNPCSTAPVAESGTLDRDF